MQLKLLLVVQLIATTLGTTVVPPSTWNYTYPWPVHYFSLTSQRANLSMAYMDVLPTNTSNSSNKTVVLLHGKNFCGATWEDTARRFSSHGYRVVIPDQIGFCKSGKPPAYQFSLQQLARNTHLLLQSLGIESTYVLGHSMGGMLATRFALMYPEQTSRLILTNPIGLEDWKALGSTYYVNTWKPEYDVWVNMLVSLYETAPENATFAWNMAQTTDMVLTQPVAYEFELIQPKTLLLIGTQDTTAIGKGWSPPEVQEKLGKYDVLGKETAARIPNADLIEFEDLGHSPHVQESERYHRALFGWLGEPGQVESKAGEPMLTKHATHGSVCKPPVGVDRTFNIAVFRIASALVPREARVVPPTSAVESWKRASPQAPNGYAPAEVDCPSTRPSIRSAGSLSDEETEWLQKRRPNTIDPMREFLERVNITGFDVGQYIDNHRDNTSALPNIALAFSGGGYRALLNDAGALAAFDSRTSNSTSAGHLGGLLQASTYVSALSGGGWLIGSIYANNFTSVEAIINRGDDSSIWQFQNSLFEGPPTEGIQLLSTAQYFENLVNTVSDKSDSPAGDFNTSITDVYGRGLSFQLINASDGAPAYTFSSIQDDNSFSSGEAPMPILVADERSPGDLIISLNATNFEFNPFEMGSFDPTTYGFAPLKYIGSNFSEGELAQDQGCVAGFDNLGFVMGTSSSLFNQIFLQLNTFDNIPKILLDFVSNILTKIGKEGDDIADYSPNPFYHYHNETNPSANRERLTLVDGGEDLQNIPLNPVIQPVRHVDVIFAVDSSGDTVSEDDPSQNWPNGTALVATYERSTSDIMNGTSFPYIPGQDTFVALGMNNRPAFFGCNSTNVTQGGNIPPLIVYLPNSPYVFWSNTSTFGKLSYTLEERNGMIENGYDVATQANSTREGASNWPTCVGCAILSRSLERNGETVPDVCQQCFEQYCWNGTTVDNAEPYTPELILSEVNSESGVGKFMPNAFGLALAAAVSGPCMTPPRRECPAICPWKKVATPPRFFTRTTKFQTTTTSMAVPALAGAPVLSTPDTHIFEDPTPAVDTSNLPKLSDEQIALTYEIERTVKEIREGQWKRIALQFPDHMLCDAPRVYEHLNRGLKKDRKEQNGVQKKSVEATNGTSTEEGLSTDFTTKASLQEDGGAVEERLFILGDTSYGACCVDEVAAEHVDADVVVHYGRSCLSPPSRLPVLYVFTARPLDIEAAIATFKETYADHDQKIILMADIPYSHHIPVFHDRLRTAGYTNLFATEIVHNPSSPLPNRTTPGEVGDADEALREYALFHISDPPTALLLTLSSRVASIHIYPTTPSPTATPVSASLASTAQTLRRRYALLTSLTTTPIFGILINTLSVKNYMHILAHVQRQIAAAGKKSYTFVVGKVNAAKVANFSEVGGWVVIGCWESSLIESGEFWRPMITPWELGVALKGDAERVWTGAWEADFQRVLDGEKEGGEEEEESGAEAQGQEQGQERDQADGHVDAEYDSEEESAPPEFDLRTGTYVSHARPMRPSRSALPTSTTKTDANGQPTPSSSSALTKRANGDIAAVGGVASPGAEYLRSNRTWQGLSSDYQNAEDEGSGGGRAAKMEEGRSGIARGYVVGEEGKIH
ncbi:lysophospholipase-like protein [Stemphylium lycopersici]|nr:lysophospholipase-like protein [Stemphylium lycopersici]